jgi:hypothetical protein
MNMLWNLFKGLLAFAFVFGIVIFLLLSLYQSFSQQETFSNSELLVLSLSAAVGLVWPFIVVGALVWAVVKLSQSIHRK